MTGYSGTPLIRKLGLKPDATDFRMLLENAPSGFPATLGPLRFVRRLRDRRR